MAPKKKSPALLQRMQTSTSALLFANGIHVPFRKRLRVFTEDRRVEGTIIFIVLVYFIVICLDFTVPEIAKANGGGYFTSNYQTFIIQWTRVFWVIDLAFLAIFVAEISLRVYAWGCTYLRDVLNLVDMVIVVSSFVLLFVTMEFTMFTCLDFEREECSGAGGGGTESARGVLRVFRIVRILRVVVILNKIKRSRENAQMLRKKAKYKRQGSPVERVIEILQRLRRKAESSADRENLAFMMDAIISDQLYTVNVSAAETSGMTTEMSAFLLEGGAQTKKQTKPAGAVGKVLTGTVSFGGKKGEEKKGKRAMIKAPGDAETQPPTTGTHTKSTAEYLPRAPMQQQQPSGIIPPGIMVAPEEAKRADRRASTSGLRSSELSWIEATQNLPEVKEVMDNIESWDFSVFDLDRVTNHHPILFIVLDVVARFELESSLPINMENLVRLLLKIEQGYNQVPFHNHVHAADVAHGTAYFMSQPAVARHMSPLDLYCNVLAAAMHDFAHPGYNNAFLVASRHETAIMYNDSSVLENFHISSSWKLLLEEDLNPFAGFTDEQYQEARQTMVYAVLGTDMKFHFDHLTKFKTRMSAGAFEDPDRKDVRLLLAMCMHSADVSNPAKKWDLTSEWATRVMEEFFEQGEEEERLGLPVSPFMDRKKTDIGQCQAGFISILIKPFFDEWTQFLGEANRHIFANVESNIKVWSEQGEAALGDTAKELHAGRPKVPRQPLPQLPQLPPPQS